MNKKNHRNIFFSYESQLLTILFCYDFPFANRLLKITISGLSTPASKLKPVLLD